MRLEQNRHHSWSCCTRFSIVNCSTSIWLKLGSMHAWSSGYVRLPKSQILCKAFIFAITQAWLQKRNRGSNSSSSSRSQILRKYSGLVRIKVKSHLSCSRSYQMLRSRNRLRMLPFWSRPGTKGRHILAMKLTLWLTHTTLQLSIKYPPTKSINQIKTLSISTRSSSSKEYVASKISAKTRPWTSGRWQLVKIATVGFVSDIDSQCCCGTNRFKEKVSKRSTKRAL